MTRTKALADVHRRLRAWTVAMKSCAATSYAAQNSSESAIIRRSKGVLESGGS